MTTLLWWMLQNTVTVALLLPLVWIAARCFRHRPAVQHLLWLVLLVKLVTPPVSAWPWSVEEVAGLVWPAPEDVAAPPVELAELAVAEMPVAEALPEISPSWDEPPVTPLSPPADPLPAVVMADTRSSSISPWSILAALWLGGSLLYTLRQGVCIARHAALIRRAQPAGEELRHEVARAAQQLRIRTPRTVVAGGIGSPFVWCFGRLRLVWPTAMGGEKELARARGILLHELAHIRRGDHYVAWLELAAGALWWWNPLFWFVRRRLREAAELACDALALAQSPGERRAYAELLLELSANFTPHAPAPVLGVSTGARSSLTRRLSMILSDRTSGRLSLTGLLLAALVAIAALPGWSVAQQGGQPDRSAEERIEQLEAQIKELTKRLEARAGQPSTAATVTTPDGGTVLIGAAPGVDIAEHRFTTEDKKFHVLVEAKSGRLTALTKDDQKLWTTKFDYKFSSGGDWKLEKAPDDYVAISWTKNGQRHMFCFSAATGELMVEDVQEVEQPMPPKPLPNIPTNPGAGGPGGAAVDPDAARLDRLEQVLRDLDERLAKERASTGRGSARVLDSDDLSALGVRFLDALTEQKLAKSRLSRLGSSAAPVGAQEEAEIALENAEKKVRLLSSLVESSHAAAKAQLDAAAKDRERTQRLFAAKAVSMQELDEVEVRVRAAMARVQQFEAIAQLREEEGKGAPAAPAKPDPNPLATAAAMTRSTNNLKQIAIALHNYHDTYGSFPTAARMKDGKPLLSWRVEMLPFLEQEALYKQFHHDEPWDSEHNQKLIEKMPEIYASPGVKLEAGHTIYLAPIGKGTIMGDKGTKFSQIIDGTSNTLMVVEANPAQAVPWTKPADLAVNEERPEQGFSGARSGGVISLFGDGSVQLLRGDLDAKVLLRLYQMNDGEVIDRDAITPRRVR